MDLVCIHGPVCPEARSRVEKDLRAAQATSAQEGAKAKRPTRSGAKTGTEALALAAAGTRDATLAQLLAFLAARIPPARQPPHLKQLGGHHKV